MTPPLPSLKEQFLKLGTWEEKYIFIIKQGKKLPPLDKKFKTEEHLIQGCQSQAWLVAQVDDSKIEFLADSDALIVKGLMALTLSLVNKKEPKKIIQTLSPELNSLDLKTHLSPSRANGLYSVAKKIKYYALAYDALIEKTKKTQS